MTNGYCSSGSSTGGAYSTGTNVPFPSAVGNRSSNRNAVPGGPAAGTGYCSPAPSSCRYVTPLQEGLTVVIPPITASSVLDVDARPGPLDELVRVFESG